MLLVEETSQEVWPQSSMVQLAIRQIVLEQQAEICIGMVAADQAAPSNRQKLIEAGFSHVEATAALEKCRGDAEKALQLLLSGWKSGATQTITEAPSSSAPVCPFSGRTGVCPVGGAG